MTPEIEHEATRLQAAGMNSIDAHHYARQSVEARRARIESEQQQIAALSAAAKLNTQVLGGK